MSGMLGIILLGLLAVAGPVLGQELQAGEVLGPANWEKARGLLPPEILKHYETGEYADEVALWEDGWIKWGPVFLSHSADNAKWLHLDDQGSIVDKRTGTRPASLYGLPFPEIEARDPHAGTKILWNYFFQGWSRGNFHTMMQLNWVGRHGLDRSAIQDVYFLFYTGQLPEYTPAANPNDLYVQFLASTISPADLQGTTALGWRYRDPDKRDSNWVYVPALRRVRAVSPANRSDGFLGSDMSQDDGPFFDGKPEDFSWKLAGEADILRLVDPYTLKGEMRLVPNSGGSWHVNFARVPMAGFQDPAWKGLPWAPRSLVLAKRKCWIVEGVPKDRYYLYGKLQLYIDKETYQGVYNRKFDWKGQLLITYSVFADMNWRFWGDDIYGAGSFYQGAENLQLDRATVATIPQDVKNLPADWRIHLAPAFFDYQALVRFGK